MGSKKKDLEIIYNLQWKNKTGNGGDKANIIGMYDIPATTLNWEIFKSYLLKNSGTVGDDVKVSYITDSNREFPIESQVDFQIALYAFRRKARMSDIVNLKLDRICEQQTHKNNRHSNDVETQFDNEAVSIVSCCSSDSPPEWFLTYMNKFKKNITEEVVASVTNIMSNLKPHTVSQPSCYHSRKSKAESSKRRKLPLLTTEGSHETTKDLIKSLKLEGKLEHKLEKLETKTKKLKEKRLALFSKSSDSDGGGTNTKRRQPAQIENEDDTLQMDASRVNTQEMIPHMLGGEIYLHQWKVINTGKLQWTRETALIFTWGSKALKPLDTIVSVPYLKPGDTGTISVRLQIPNQPGQYECYFHFHHQSRRFGHWLGCQVIVDPFDLKGNKSVLETSFPPPLNLSASREVVNNSEDLYNISNPVTRYGDIWQGTSVAANTFDYIFNVDSTSKKEVAVAPSENKCGLYDEQLEPTNLSVDKVVRELSSRVEDIKLQDPTDTNCSSDSDNQSIISFSGSNSSKGVPAEYVVVPIPDCFQVEGSNAGNAPEIPKKPVEQVNVSEERNDVASAPCKEEKSEENFDNNNNEDTHEQKENGKNDETCSNSSHKSDIVMVTLTEANQDTEEYACVIVDGQKVMIPKKIIKSEYLQSAEKTDNDAAESQVTSETVETSTSLYTMLQNEILKLEKSSTENQLDIDSAATENQLEIDSATIIQDGHFEENDFGSHCSAAGSCFSETAAERNNRLFIFPQTCPGYEVIHGNECGDVTEDNYTWSKSDTQYAYRVHGMKEPLIPIPASSEPVEIPTTSNKNPFATETITHVPNYQQTPPEDRKAPSEEEMRAQFAEEPIIPPELAAEDVPNRTGTPPLRSNTPPHRPSTEHAATAPPASSSVHILPERLVSGAVNVARSVMNRIVPQVQSGKWVNGHWVCTNPDSLREANLQALAEMGFWNRDLNATLLARYNDDLSRVVGELVQ